MSKENKPGIVRIMESPITYIAGAVLYAAVVVGFYVTDSKSKEIEREARRGLVARIYSTPNPILELQISNANARLQLMQSQSPK